MAEEKRTVVSVRLEAEHMDLLRKLRIRDLEKGGSGHTVDVIRAAIDYYAKATLKATN